MSTIAKGFAGAPLMLKARGVTRRFGGLVAVNAVDFEIPKGMIAAIIGPNGAGKTTFFNVIAGIYAPTEGQIELDGRVLVSPPRGEGRESSVLVAMIAPFALIALWFLLVVGGDAGFYPGVAAVVGAMLAFIAGLLLNIIRPAWYARIVRRIGIYRPARPNDMVEAGLARTFQNIRLYKSLTVLENILVGMHVHLRAGFGGAIFQGRAVRDEEASAESEARELLRFVGLGGLENELAKSLPYGSQRLLEIADRKSTRLNSSHTDISRMPSSA